MLRLHKPFQIFMITVRFHPFLSHFNEVREEILGYPQQALHVIFRFRARNLVCEIFSYRDGMTEGFLIKLIWMLIFMFWRTL